MPELPEVESIKLQLNKFLVGHTITDLTVNYQKTFKGSRKDIIGGKVKDVRRFGKALVIDLSNNNSIIIHVKMTGQLIYRGPNLKNTKTLSDKVKGGLTGKHTHVIFDLDKGGKLYFVDYRKFGWIDTVDTNNVEKSSFIGKLGPDFIKDLTEAEFENILSKSSQKIKLVIMDQEKVSGVGNIYANDALFLARIKPDRKSSSLSKKETETLYRSIKSVLEKGIKYGGASELAFVTPDGTEGNYQKHTLVYGRQGESCPNGCHGKIKKVKMGGRGTYFCPNCQK